MRIKLLLDESQAALMMTFKFLQSPAAIPQPTAEKPLQAKPIYTSPHKKGSYGFNKTTLSERKGAMGVVSPLTNLNKLPADIVLFCFLLAVQGKQV